jgi:hypothetical protein
LLLEIPAVVYLHASEGGYDMLELGVDPGDSCFGFSPSKVRAGDDNERIERRRNHRDSK